MRTTLLILVAAMAFVACGGTRPKPATDSRGVQTQTPVDMHNAENSLDYQGVYKGTFPAADCPGINVELTLGADDSYAESYKYIARDADFTERGTYTVRGNLLTLKPNGEQQSESYYKVEENRLLKMNAEKQVITGALANNYILNKIK